MERERQDGVVIPVERETPPVRVVDSSPDVRVVDRGPDVRMSSQVIEPRDRVRWGPIWAGLTPPLQPFSCWKC